MHACDVSRLPDGSFQVNADWTQAPSGAGYALADRRVIAHAIPDLYERIAPRPTTPFAQALRLALIDAAPDVAQDPVVVVLVPGHLLRDRFRSGVSGYAAGFSAGGKHGFGGARRQAVDALAGHAQTSRCGSSPRRRGLRGPAGSSRRFQAGCRRFGGGAAPRNGDRRQHPGQRHPGKPWAVAFSARARRATARRSPAAGDRTGLLGRHRRRTLAPAGQSVVAVDQVHRRRENPCRAYTFVCPAAELAARIEDMPWQWVGQELPQFSSAPTDHAGVLSSAGIGMRLFTVAQRSGYAPMIGGVGYVLAPGPCRIHAENRCGKGCLGTPNRAGPSRGGHRSSSGALGYAAGEDGCGHLGGQLATCAVRPVLDGTLRRARGEHGPVADRRPRPLPRLPAAAGHRRKLSVCRC